jgi:2-C-methyl-D-erythritol 4-phosphate cytidylyltransferase
MPEFAVIIPAAGSSTRFGGPKNKLFEQLGPARVIQHTLKAFLDRPDVAKIVIPTAASDELVPLLPPDSRLRVRCCLGGASRAQSVLNALWEVPKDIEWVAVHDGARPLVSQSLIGLTLDAAIKHGAAVPALPVALTIKEAAGPLPARVERTIPRERLWAMQTPQIVRRADLLTAFLNCPIPLEQVTDDVQLIELAGGEVWLVPGEERNLKITTRTDLRVAEILLADDGEPGR